VFSGIKPYTIIAEQLTQRVKNAIAIEGETNPQTIGFVTAALQDLALKSYYGLSSHDLKKKDWEIVETQVLKFYSTGINTTTACKDISTLYQGSKTVLN
jgi:hypothetical protein